MADILLSNRAIQNAQLAHQCSIDSEEMYQDDKSSTVFANKPYLVNKRPSNTDLAILYTLRNSRKNKHLTEVALALGEEYVMGIAEIMNPISENSEAFWGAATGVYNGRIANFQNAIQNYQSALLKYRDAIKSSTTKTNQHIAKQEVIHAYKRMQQKFQLELGMISNQSQARKGTVLSSSTRGINIATSSRNAAKLNVSTQAQAHNLVNFSQYARYLGNGLVVLDFSKRIGNVHNSYRAGENWEREMFIESSSFAVSSISGLLTASALSFLLIATPMGWIGLIAGGLAVAGSSAGVSILTNDYMKNNSGAMYDNIMDWLTK